MENSWIETFSGIKFYPFRPRLEEIKILDIAHALSNLCRYTGHCSSFYSVAQHCVLGTRLLQKTEDKKLCRIFLLHDASEIYLNDLAAPVKWNLPVYVKAELEIDMLVSLRFNLQYPWPEKIKEMDIMMRYFEAHALGFKHVDSWGFPFKPNFRLVIEPWSPVYAKRQFTKLYYELFGKKYGKI